MAKAVRRRVIPTAAAKPPYRVPSMAEIAALPWNGFKAISTFSGAGGSCLGYRLAGYRVLWASEFIPAAQQVYKLNHPDSILDKRDIRKVQPEDILKAIGLNVGDIDLMDGSPPCAAFSTAGKLEKGWGKVKAYSDTRQRVDDLFFEYARLVKGLQPKVFVAENVSGLIKGKAKGYFKLILQELKDCGYNVQARLLDAQWLGVPQMRQRLIFVGVRNDIPLTPVFPKPLPYFYSVAEALPWIAAAEEDTGGQWSTGDITNRPAPTVRAKGTGQLYVEAEAWLNPDTMTAKLWDETLPGQTLSDASKRVQGKDSFLTHSKAPINRPAFTVTQGVQQQYHPTERRKFAILELKRICGFPDDFKLVGSYAQQWERLGRAVPPVMMSHIAKAIQEGVLERCAA